MSFVFLVCYVETDGGAGYLDSLVIRGICDTLISAEEIYNKIKVTHKLDCCSELYIKQVELNKICDSGVLVYEINKDEK